MIELTRHVSTAEDLRAVEECYRSGWLTMGPRTQELESAFARTVGATHAVAVSSGTSALHLALLAAGVGPGDDVLVPALGFAGLPALVRRLGARPLPVDVRGPLDHALDLEDAERSVTPATRALVVDHRWGHVAPAEALTAIAGRHGLTVVEDAAHAISADGVGSGTAACFSLSSTKALAVGEGGIVTTDDDAVAARVRSLRSHAMTSVTWDRHRGHASTYDVVDLGYNARIDEPRAALGLTGLDRLPSVIAHRRELVATYREVLADRAGVEVPFAAASDARAGHGAFGVLLSSAGHLRSVVETAWAAGVETAPVDLGAWAGDELPPRAADVAARLLRLPLHAAMDADDVRAVCATVVLGAEPGARCGPAG